MIRALTLLLALSACTPNPDRSPGSVAPAASETSLMRLTLWVPPRLHDDLGRAYENELLPILKRHGFRPAQEPGRATVDSAFCRLFSFNAATAINSALDALSADSTWALALHGVAESLDLAANDNPLGARLEGYRTVLGPGVATPVGSGARQGLWLNLGARDNAAFRIVNGIHRDQAGDVWVNSGWQLTRFDGERLTRFPGRIYSSCTRLADDGTGGLWLDCGGTVGHLARGTVHWLGRADGLDRSPGQPRAQGLAVDTGGRVWIAGDHGLARYDGAAVASLPLPQDWAGSRVSAVRLAADGSLWVAHQDGISRWDGNHWTTSLQAARFGGGSIGIIEPDARGRLWLGIRDRVLRFDGDGLEDLTDALGVDPEARAVITNIAAHPDGGVWIGTNGGVVHFDGETFTPYDQRHGVGGIQIEDVHIDSDGLVWVATFSGGISRWDGARIRQYHTGDGLPTPYVFDAARAPDGTLWFGARGGLVRTSGAGFVTYTAADGLSGERIWRVLAARDGTVWAGAAGMGAGLTRVDAQGIIDVSDGSHGLPDVSIVSLVEDGDGTIWVMSHEGDLFRSDGPGFVPVEAPKWMLRRDQGPLGIDAEGILWLLDADGRAWRRSGDRFELVAALLDHTVRQVEADADGLVWIHTSDQLLRFDGEWITGTFDLAGLSWGSVDLFQDRSGHLWLSCFGLGMVQFDGRVFQTLSRRDGLSDNGVQAVVQDDDGDLWIATDGGITRYTPTTRPPAVRLTEVIADRTYGQVDSVEVSSTQDFIVIAFQGRSLTTPPDRMAYVYRLAGIEADWRVASGQRAEYRGLSTGDHLFEVMAVDLDLNYSPPATLRIIVHPAYGEWAFGLLAVLGLAGTGLGGIIAVRRRRERDESRDLLGRERRRRMVVQTHEIEVWTFVDFVETSRTFGAVLDEARQLSGVDTPMLITGEPGTGKELLARAVQAEGVRHAAAFVPVRCATLPAEVDSLELRTQALSLLLGSSVASTPVDEGAGLILQADGGTLFLDEVGLLALPLQSHLLRILRQGRLRRPGGTSVETFDVRVIASSSYDLEAQIAASAFDAEFYNFLTQGSLEIPPLRDRRQDISSLAARMADEANAAGGRGTAPLPPEVLQRLGAEPLPGNARELRQLVLREVTGRAGSAG